MTEADTCRTYVVPRLHEAGWSDEQIREQVSFTDSRIIPAGSQRRGLGLLVIDLRCGQGKTHPVARWTFPGPCPKCGQAMNETGVVGLTD